MEKRQPKYIDILGKAGIVIFIIIGCISLYCMINHCGQVEGINFGPGQYYYTDIPNWRDYFLKDYYNNTTPMAVLIGLFFAWGLVMYKVWVWVDEKIK